MKSVVSRTKAGLYILLALLTGIFAFISFRFYSYDIEMRLNPQVERAIIQASRLLPQLEENEDALREISVSLEKSRRRILRASRELADDQAWDEEENVETVISETISWMNRITKLRVGRRGHVIVVSQNDYTILAHPDERFVGEKVHPLWGKLDREAIPDLKKLHGKITRKDLPEEYYLFFPHTFFMRNPDTERYYAAVDAGVYGSVFSYGDTYIICGVTLYETLAFVVFRCFFSTLFFFVFAWVFVRYVGFSLIRHMEAPEMFRKKLASYGAISVIVLFGVFWYYQTMMDVTGDIATMNEHAEAAVETLNTYHRYSERLAGWLDEQYLEKCRLTADLVRKQGKEHLTRKDMAELARDLDVEYIYVYDKKGKVIVTNSPYDHFTLSTDEAAPSYAFRPLLDGKEYVIQDVRTDDFGERRQYIGVSLRDENDLCDGFVQIAVDPQLRDRLLDPINVQGVLDNLVIGIPRYALAIDKNTMKIVAATGLGYENANAEELGLDAGKIEDNYNGILTINGETYYTGVSRSENLYLMPLLRSTDNSGALAISCVLALFSAAAYFLLVLISQRGYRKAVLAGTAEQTEAGGSRNVTGVGLKKAGTWSLWGGLPKAEEKDGFEARWKKQSAVPVEEQTPEMRIRGIIYRLLLAFSVVFLLFETVLIYAGITQGTGLDGFSYVLLGNWEKGLHLFSFSYCLFLLCVLYVFRELLNQTLYQIAKISDMRSETILLLLRSALKYACALIFLYIGLAKFGIDTRALWASAGVLSLMIGFGAKDLISDIVAGLFIIFEGTYKIGDWITVGSWYGTVEEIGLRYTKIEYNGDTKFLNNSSVRDLIRAEGEVVKELLMVPVPYETDLLEIEKLLNRELPVIAPRITGIAGPLRYEGVNSFEDSCVMLRLSIMCTSEGRKKARRALLREIKLLFERKHVSIPYSHVVVSDYKEENNTYVDAPDTAPEEETGGAGDPVGPGESV